MDDNADLLQQAEVAKLTLQPGIFDKVVDSINRVELKQKSAKEKEEKPTLLEKRKSS